MRGEYSLYRQLLANLPQSYNGFDFRAWKSHRVPPSVSGRLERKHHKRLVPRLPFCANATPVIKSVVDAHPTKEKNMCLRL